MGRSNIRWVTFVQVGGNAWCCSHCGLCLESSGRAGSDAKGSAQRCRRKTHTQKLFDGSKEPEQRKRESSTSAICHWKRCRRSWDGFRRCVCWRWGDTSPKSMTTKSNGDMTQNVRVNASGRVAAGEPGRSPDAQPVFLPGPQRTCRRCRAWPLSETLSSARA